MRTLYLILFLLVGTNAFSFDEEEAGKMLFKANKAYAGNNFNRAGQLYDSLINLGYISADVHYNLGNALYKQNRIAEAILHYEKSLKLDPGMKDAAHNLKLANLKTVDKIESIPDLFIVSWWKNLLNLFHADEWATFSVLVLFFALLGAIIYLFAPIELLKKAGFYLGIALRFLCIVTWLLAARQHAYLQKSTEAIIITPTINVNSSPTNGSTKLFVLHQGTKVSLLDKSEEWIKIRIPDGNEGWMREKDLREI